MTIMTDTEFQQIVDAMDRFGTNIDDWYAEPARLFQAYKDHPAVTRLIEQGASIDAVLTGQPSVPSEQLRRQVLDDFLILNQQSVPSIQPLRARRSGLDRLSDVLRDLIGVSAMPAFGAMAAAICLGVMTAANLGMATEPSINTAITAAMPEDELISFYTELEDVWEVSDDS